jgi:hypothetical protein
MIIKKKKRGGEPYLDSKPRNYHTYPTTTTKLDNYTMKKRKLYLKKDGIRMSVSLFHDEKRP